MNNRLKNVSRFSKRLGQKVRKIRLEREESQEVFAKSAGITRGFLSDIERGTREVSIDTAVRLAFVSCRPLNSLLGLGLVA